MILVSDGQNTGQHRVIQASGTSGEEQNPGNEFEIVFIENSTTPAGSTIIDGKTQTIYTTTGGNDKTTHFMSPIGSLQLTAEECNEILMKRAVAAVQNQQQQHTITTTSSSDQHSSREYSISL